jgi:hypothetical protein
VARGHRRRQPVDAVDGRRLSFLAIAIGRSAVSSILPLAEDSAIAQLQALDAPASDDAKVAGFWSAMEQQVPIVRQIASSLQSNNLQGAQTAAQQLKTASRAGDAQMAAYGLVACAQ